ncbi:alpha/beta hydrolase-fold protein [Ruminococcus bicirculans (ex Wegman et al. 2014)]|uniref:alpha/beta hydrolase-fold protein n=1 Tax=Ruminococcus bicirculans (ex Wegman et al. 2014) TaxID=1160721 RepID=UPI003FEE276D
MNAMKRFALLGTVLMSFLTGCGTQQENTANSQTIPKAAVSSDTVKEIAQTGMSTTVPDIYLQPIEQAGTVTQITYDSKDFVRDGSDITKTAYVYLPYGYDENDTETRYNICYLMHGWGGHAGEYFQYANITDMLDNMIAKGDIPPTIFVSATFYNDNSDTGFSGSVAEFRQFHRDFEEYLMPAVEEQFHTYAESTSPDDLKASRDHRAFGGFSLGSVTTWLQFCYDSDYIRYFLPMSGSCWYYGGYGDFQIEKNVDFIQQLIQDNDLDERGYFIYHGVGTNDTVKSQSIDMAEEMLSRSEVFTPDHYVFYQREGGQHDHISCREFMYNALPLFFGGENVQTDSFTENTTVAEVKANVAFGDFGRLLFPVDRTVSDDMTLKDVSSSSTYTWYNYIKPEKTVEIVNYLKNAAESGQQIFYNIYTEEEMQADSSLRDTGLFFFKGEDNAKFAVCNAGGGFAYVGAMHDSFPHALELSKMGYNAFALIYRPDAPYDDLARAIEFIHDNADTLKVDPNDYSLWGGSAGARMAAMLGNSDYLQQLTGRTDIGQAGAVIMQYTGYTYTSKADAPTYVCVGTSDGIANWKTMQNRLNTLESYGIPTEFHAYEGLPHGFGLGTGTVAEGWIYDAVNFWEEQFSGTIPTKREPANLQNCLMKRKLLNGSIEFGTQKKDGFIVDNVLHSEIQGDIHFSSYIPESYDGSEPYALFVTLPGWEGLYFQGVGANLVESYPFEARNYNDNMIVLSTQLDDWGETSANMAIELTEYFLEHYNIDRKKVYLHSFSGGGETGSLVMGKRPELFSAYLMTSSKWDGNLDVLANAHTPVYMAIGEDDSYYGSGYLKQAYSDLYSLYKAQGLSADEISELLVLDVKEQDYFSERGFQDQHGGGMAFAEDESIMSWLFSQ